jgi:hypothetical protein
MVKRMLIVALVARGSSAPMERVVRLARIARAASAGPASVYLHRAMMACETAAKSILIVAEAVRAIARAERLDVTPSASM